MYTVQKNNKVIGKFDNLLDAGHVIPKDYKNTKVVFSHTDDNIGIGNKNDIYLIKKNSNNIKETYIFEKI